MENTQKKIVISKKKFTVFVIVLLAIGAGIVLSHLNGVRMGSSASRLTMDMPAVPYEKTSIGIANSMGNSMMPDIYPGYNTNGSISDTREFMKVSYSGQLKTRKVKETFRNVKSIVSDNDGRIDNFSQNEKSGYVSFVVPKDKFEIFRTEIESLTHEKLYVESISSTNLLSQKQNIEQRQDVNNESLASLEEQNKILTTQYNKKVAKINKDLESVKTRLTYERNSQTQIKDESLLAASKNQESVLYQQQIDLEKQLTSEGNNYNNQQILYKFKINQIKGSLTALDKEDTKFTDNVETVNGYVNVTWVSLWQLAKIFSPIHPTIVLIILAVLLLMYLKRKNHIPKIEFV